jgi:hypothetical protein
MMMTDGEGGSLLWWPGQREERLRDREEKRREEEYPTLSCAVDPLRRVSNSGAHDRILIGLQ